MQVAGDGVRVAHAMPSLPSSRGGAGEIPVPASERAQWNLRPSPTTPPPIGVQMPDAVPPTPTIAPLAPSPACPMPVDARTMAALASDVYLDAPRPPAGWAPASEADLAALRLDRQTLESDATGFRARVYVETCAGEPRYVVAFRGTHRDSEWGANFRQAAGLRTDHYRRAMLIGQRVARAAHLDVSMTGHSLGGGLASAASVASGRPGTTFNAAGLSRATLTSADAARAQAGDAPRPTVMAYYVRGEILSAIQDGGDRLIGALLGGVLLGPGGGAAGAALDAPPAYGERHALDAVRPPGTGFFGDNPLARHEMDWIHAAL